MQASVAPLKPTGFWSYHRPDGGHSDGRMARLHALLEGEIRGRVGEAVRIFRDEETLRVGAEWEREINDELDRSSFLIAVVTPGFLRSKWCCDEVLRFRQREAALGRHDLIFPIHYIDVADFRAHRRGECHDPAVLDLLYQRQLLPFENFRHDDTSDPTVRRIIGRLARDIYARLYALDEAPAAPADAAPVSTVSRARAAGSSAPRPVPPSTLASAPRPAPSGEVDPEMARIEPKPFIMGVSDAEEARENVPKDYRGRALPQRKVTIARDFWIGRYPVTRGEFAHFIAESGYDIPKGAYTYVVGMGWAQSAAHDWRDPGFPQDDRHPVVCVNHDDASAYTRWLSDKTGRHYRLPTEAEWEYAARAGTTTARFWGDDRDGARRHANVADRSLMREWKMQFDPEQFFDWDDGFPFTAPVGSFDPNPLGLYDMLGNVWEWTQDHWHDNYKGAPTDGSAWTTGGSKDGEGLRVLRGGAWDNDPWGVRAGARLGDHGGGRDSVAGFRLARTL